MAVYLIIVVMMLWSYFRALFARPGRVPSSFQVPLNLFCTHFLSIEADDDTDERLRKVTVFFNNRPNIHAATRESIRV